jgi:hypothetical protein
VYNSSYTHVGFDVFTAVTIKNAVLVFLLSAFRLLVTAKVLLSSPILVTLMMEELSSSETSYITRVTRRNIIGDGFLQVIRSI